MNELNRLLQRLIAAEFDFVIVGGFAATLHGSSMLTRDLDVCAVVSEENIEKLRRAFADLHPVYRMSPERWSFLDHPAPGVVMNHLYLQTDLGPLDVLGSITGVGGFEAVREHAVAVELFGQQVRVISVADLIRAKETLARPKDRMVALELRALRDRQGD
ncbi:MAG: nucleotidyltransferase [Xanthomonadales bacterium]|nr:nucleotidyltransferase [Xanthomonadales bacterium]